MENKNIAIEREYRIREMLIAFFLVLLIIADAPRLRRERELIEDKKTGWIEIDYTRIPTREAIEEFLFWNNLHASQITAEGVTKEVLSEFAPTIRNAGIILGHREGDSTAKIQFEDFGASGEIRAGYLECYNKDERDIHISTKLLNAPELAGYALFTVAHEISHDDAEHCTVTPPQVIDSIDLFSMSLSSAWMVEATADVMALEKLAYVFYTTDDVQTKGLAYKGFIAGMQNISGFSVLYQARGETDTQSIGLIQQMMKENEVKSGNIEEVPLRDSFAYGSYPAYLLRLSMNNTHAPVIVKEYTQRTISLSYTHLLLQQIQRGEP